MSKRCWLGFCMAILALAAPALAQDADARAREIVSRMTLDEKLTELHGMRDVTHFRYVPGIPRLGIPAFPITNGPAGAGPGGAGPQVRATALPAPIALAATWDRELSRAYGVIVGSESRDVGNGLVEAPTINIARLPQNGRTFEGYGEDPYLVGELAVANIQGIQSQGIIANVKHYAANNQETDRFVVNAVIDERTLREIYLPAFERAIHDGHSASLMCAYPKVNGTYACENVPLMNILKKEWGFTGFVTSDFGAVHSAAESALAGLDLEMPTGKYFAENLKAAVESGQVPIAVIDEKLIRRFRAMIELGVYDHPPAPKPLPEREHGVVARQIAESGIVLLKNSGGLLPLKAGALKSVALIGPFAAKAMTGGGGSSHVMPLYTVDPPDGLRSRLAASATLTTLDGADIPAAVAAARAADVCIVMVGDRDSEGRDQPLALSSEQDDLVRAVTAANPKTVVVVKSGSAVLMPWMEQAPAIVEAWYPGEEDGNAVASVLFGEVNPSGKLPITFPRRVDDTFAGDPLRYPGVDKVARYSEGVFVGYRYYDAHNVAPLFPFGHGLSYTTFAYRGLRVSQAPGAGSARVVVEFDIQNSGAVAGSEVAQVYVGLPSSDGVPQPPRQLKGFEKLRLEPEQSRHVRLTLDERALSYWDVSSHGWKVAPGVYTIAVGSSSRDLRLNSEVRITGGDE